MITQEILYYFGVILVWMMIYGFIFIFILDSKMNKTYIFAIGSFCLGFSLTGIILAVGIICMVKVIEK